ncbi:MAG: zinc ribbon domain-containing protein [Actinobacteria bacterium]|nr:zinc ribbon domain-containing protein [Actinomycetota bacterium]
MRCPECQAENADDAEFCSLCYARFKTGLRSRETEERARRLLEENEGSRLRCPSCGDLSPLDAQFCLRCGFVFEDPASIMVSGDEARELERRREDSKREEIAERPLPPLVMAPGVDGGMLMRDIEAALERGQRPRLQARGREGITHAMKLLALLAGELRIRGKEMLVSPALLGEKATVDLDEVELEMTLEIKEGAVEG